MRLSKRAFPSGSSKCGRHLIFSSALPFFLYLSQNYETFLWLVTFRNFNIIFIFYYSCAGADRKAKWKNLDTVPSVNPDDLSSYITCNWHVENKQNLDKNLHSSAFRRPAIVSFGVQNGKKKISSLLCWPEAVCVLPAAEVHGVAAKPACDNL